MVDTVNRITEVLASSALNNFITSNSWMWPTLEMLHFFGLCLLLGSLLIVDLSVIGFARNISLNVVDKFIIATLIGFSINLITGVFFVVGDPARYFANIAFQMKIAVIILAGINALYFTIRVRPGIAAGNNNFTKLPVQAKISTSLSLLFWTSVVVLGRFIPYVEDL